VIGEVNMATELERSRLIGVVPDGAVGPSRSALLVALVDRAQHDRAFGAELRREAVSTAARVGLRLSDAEWNGLRAFLIEEVMPTFKRPRPRQPLYPLRRSYTSVTA
jgi:hypothetical protein